MSVRSIFFWLFHDPFVPHTLHHPDSLDLYRITIPRLASAVRDAKGRVGREAEQHRFGAESELSHGNLFGMSSSGGQLLYRDRDTDSDERTSE